TLRRICQPIPRFVTALALVVAAGSASAVPVQAQDVLDTPNPAGVLRTISVNGHPLDSNNPFFQSLGTNGRACVSCHAPSAGWTITPALVQARFRATDGLDPIFRTNDGSNSPLADVSTPKVRYQAYSMLLSKGVIRVGLAIPADAEFELIEVDDPYGYASAAE